MGTITIGSRSFETPILVPSISSFETQLRPDVALNLQLALEEPITLISAYDVWQQPELGEVAKAFRQQGIILLDSGGYESSRISQYAGERNRWSYTHYIEIVRKQIHDLVFSFDYFLTEQETLAEYAGRLIQEFRSHELFVDPSQLIPVVHIQSIDGKRWLETSAAVDLFGTLAKSLPSTFIAVPERELGFGIEARTELARQLAASIAPHSLLHILGCGNLLSFSMLSVAGVAMCDGLEWCRTLAAENFHLHHFQHGGVFADPGLHLSNPAAAALINSGVLDYRTSVGVRNLLTFQTFTNRLHASLKENAVHRLVQENYGEQAGRTIKAFEQ